MIRLLPLAITLLVCAIALPAQSSPAADAVAIRSIDPRDGDFADLAPILTAIGDARIVVLGEATHGDGATLRAKSRLVRALHQRLGFDVLLFEAGVIGSWAADAAFREGRPPALAARHLMSGGWQTSTNTRPTFEYVSEQRGGPTPISLGGFDSERGPHGAENLGDALLRIAARLGSPAPRASRTLVQKAAASVTRALGDTSGSLTVEDRRAIHALLDSLDGRLRGCTARCPLPREQRIRARMTVGAFRWNLTLDALQQRRAFAEWNNVRDSVMAEQVRWLADSLYPNRRIIVWAATAHFIANASEIRRVGSTAPWGVQQAGEWLRRWYGDALYHIAFTAGTGLSGAIYAGSPPSVDTLSSATGTLEADLLARDLPFAFLDLRARPERRFRAHVLGRQLDDAPWRRIIDGILYIREQEPDRHTSG